MKAGIYIKWVRKFLKGVAVAMLLCILVSATYFAWLRYASPPPLPHSHILGSPSELSAQTGNGFVALTWNSAPDAMSYQVLRSEKEAGEFLLAGSPFGSAKYGAFKWTGTVIFDHWAARTFPWGHFGQIPRPPFVDTHIKNGKTYYYKVRATDGTGWTNLSPVLKVTVPPSKENDAIIRVRIDGSRVVGSLNHIWETAVGSEHLEYMFRSDISPNIRNAGAGLRSGNLLAHQTLGIRYLVAHSILNDDLGVYRESPDGNPGYNWSGIDRIYDAVLADGMKPFVQLDFMPAALARSPNAANVFYKNPSYFANASPPKDYRRWASLVSALATHLIQRYGQSEVESWPFQVWNEPDICVQQIRVCYWRGADEDYFRLYDYAAQAIKNVDPHLRVGGPVAVSSSFVERFLKHVSSQISTTGEGSIPLDFLDIRSYQTAAEVWRPMLERYGMGHIPIYFTEWGVREQIGDPVNDMTYGAAWVVRSLHDSFGRADLISLWTASDYFEEQGQPKTFFHGGFGMIGLDGIRKPRYWASYLLHSLGTTQIALEGEGEGFDAIVTGWATADEDGHVCVLLSNVTYDQNDADGVDSLRRHIVLELTGFKPHQRFRLDHYRIDNDHTNVYRAWKEMGSPDWPNPKQLAELHEHDGLDSLQTPAELSVDSSGRVAVEFDLPMPGVSLVSLTPRH